MTRIRTIGVLLSLVVLELACASGRPASAQQREGALGGYELRLGGTFGVWGMSYAVRFGGLVGFGKHITPLLEVGVDAVGGVAGDDISTPYGGGGPFLKLNLRTRSWVNPFLEVGMHVVTYKNDRADRSYLVGFNPSLRLGAEFLLGKGVGIRFAVGGDGFFDRERSTGGFTLGELGLVVHF